MPTYNQPQQVSITVASPPTAVIHYTTDGSPATELSPVYNPASPLLISTDTTIRAVGVNVGYVTSAEASVDLIINLNKVYYGYSPLTTLTEAQLLAISNSPGSNFINASDCFGTFAFGSGGTSSDYFYFWWPDTFSTPSSTNGFLFTASGFPMAMAETSQGYTDGPLQGWYWKNLTVNGQAGKLFRTFYALGNGTTQSITVQ